MNQFKRAKQIGHQTESITDLKTAGVANTETQTIKQNTDGIIKEKVNTSAALNSEPATVPQSTVPAEKDITIETPVSAPVNIPVSEPLVMTDTVPTSKSIDISQTTIHNSLPSEQPQDIQPTIVPPTTIVQQQYPEYNVTYSEPAPVKSAKNSKKSAPNMFIQKGESKSIRKSLVLRPSSVKIAENYCAKNGGSFNELIQILLDNFIEEYGL